VFFGENVPRDRVDSAFGSLDKADAMLIVGSSLMVYSGFRFVQQAASLGKPAAAVNVGRTRADGLLAFKAEEPCESALAFLLGARAVSGSIQPMRLKPYASSALVSPAEAERSRERHGADD
jgi:NAD-dependent SIR2 family protein deacetylase